MYETDYSEPMHVLLDWSKEHRPVSAEEHHMIDEAGAQVDAYMGGSYYDVQIDIVQETLSKLQERRSAVAPQIAKVVPIVPTVYVVKATPVA